MAQAMMDFDGATYDSSQDRARLTGQALRVFHKMVHGDWWTLYELSRATGDPEASVSARLRDLRKERNGGHKVDRRRSVHGSQWEYRLDLEGRV